MNNPLIYGTTVLVWGSTWLAINYQLGVVPLEVSVFYRYALAALLLLGFCAVTGRTLRFNLAEHKLFAGVGALMFSLNYLMAYAAQQYVSSALNALIFSCILWLNILNARIFLKVRSEREVLLGAAFGMLGIVVLFWPSLSTVEVSDAVLLGGAFSLMGALSASLGNILSQHALTQLPVLQVNAWGMSYGALFNLLVCLALGRPFLFDPSIAYVGSLLYLVLAGSIVAFVLYLTLVSRIGAHRAGYTVVMFPVVATLLAVAFEGLELSRWLLAGMALVLTGNVMILRQGKKASQDTRRFSGNENSA